MSTSGKPAVNCANGKPSWVALNSTTDVFSGSTKVTSVVDSANGLTFEGKEHYRGNPKVLPIKLKGQGSLKDVDPPSEGTITVTTTSPSNSTDVPVVYVNDGT
jgi:hypothetical protein